MTTTERPRLLARTAPTPGASRRALPPLIFTSLAIGAATFSALQSLLGPALPALQGDLGTTPAGIAWTMTAWLLAAAVATPIMGRVGDGIGKKRALLAVLAVVIVGSLVSASASTLPVMLAGRVLQGLGASVSPLAFGIIRDTFPARRVPSAIGAMAAVLAAGGGLGTVLAGPIIETTGWRGLFWIPAALLAVTTILVTTGVPASPRQGTARFDPLSAVLLATWLVALLLPLSEGPTWGWGSPATIGSFLLAAGAVLWWVRTEARSARPLIDLSTMRRPVVWRTIVVAALLGAAQFALLTYAPVLLQTDPSTGYGLGLSAGAAGLVMLPILVGMTLGGIVAGPATRYVTLPAQLAGGAALMASGSLAYALLHESLGPTLAAGGLFGLGLGLGFAAMTSIVVVNVPASQTGAATGAVQNARTIGGALGTAAFSALVAAATGGGDIPHEWAYTSGFLVLAAAGTLAILFAVATPRGDRTAKTP
ncbi:MFS transporter [Myceligenerans indicum]|uniref:MFS transporter n=1 Tax=Myceligenerans indicum TaxID=2593663 RepID=A0ABS1LMB1_9MICO|nr:MFS transporter [Myceligenerans indicum]MBL0887410.1 MFS transporter [Myceligenerans indicum]